MKRIACFLPPAAAIAALAPIAAAQSNIDNTVPNKHAWGESIGWTNWHDANAGAQGVKVGPFVMQGFIWGENIGFINVGDGTPANPPYYANLNGTDFGVNIVADGDLHGFAWSENTGWINFDGGAMATPPIPARIVCGDVGGGIPARLTGYVWGENIGWINLDRIEPIKFVSLSLAATPAACDVNWDGDINGLDVQPFVDALLMMETGWAAHCAGDVEMVMDGVIDFDDLAPFVDCLIAQP